MTSPALISALQAASGTRARRASAGRARGGVPGGSSASQQARLEAMRRIELHHGQTLAWQARAQGYRIIAVFAGSGGGKTYYGPRHFYPLLAAPGGLAKTYLFTEPTWRMLKRVMLPVVVPFLDAFGMGRMHYGDMLYELRDGGRILFGSVDNPNSLQGAHVDGGLWADEIGLYTEEAWDVLLQRAALYQAHILATSTPYTLPWVEQRLAKPANHPRTASEYRCIHFPSIWNPSYPQDEYFKLKHTWPADKFRRLMEGQFTRIGGLVFDSYEDTYNLATMLRYHGPVSDPDDERVRIIFKHPIYASKGRVIALERTWAAQDWGWNPDPGCQLLLGEDARGHRYVLEEDYDTQVHVEKGTREGKETWTARALKRRDEWGCDALYCDPSMPAYIEAMREHGLPALAANASVEYGIDEVNQALARGPDGMPGLFIAQNACPNLVRTIGSYVRQKVAGTDYYLPKPAPRQEDHALDCLRYGTVGDKRKPKPEVITVPVSIRAVAAPSVVPAGRTARRGGNQRQLH